MSEICFNCGHASRYPHKDRCKCGVVVCWDCCDIHACYDPEHYVGEMHRLRSLSALRPRRERQQRRLVTKYGVEVLQLSGPQNSPELRRRIIGYLKRQQRRDGVRRG